MEKSKVIAFNAVVIVICLVVAYVLYQIFDAATHDVIEEIHRAGLHGVPLEDKIWVMELLITYVFLAMLTTHHFLQISMALKAAFDDKHTAERNLWPHAYGFCAIVFFSMFVMIIFGRYIPKG
ncbi:hypothetical protein [Caballeronia novacaledonica]|uniref:Uncharacterized protein n=1 Tax=Caballeronia novacaledonica TaxID=1544861 RepID=A0AA37MI69_9BURK|nr:hypothetical protein [Caballeronia novacaledonica]GJH28155.1 hypothetical protein CBA19CS42_26585 [Caballeronia novacaledonica]